MGFDYERQNDLDIQWNREYISKIFQTSGGMPPTYTENKYNEYRNFRTAYSAANRNSQRETTNQILQDDMRSFTDQFTELERFVSSMEEFIEMTSGLVDRLSRIPTRSP